MLLIQQHFFLSVVSLYNTKSIINCNLKITVTVTIHEITLLFLVNRWLSLKYFHCLLYQKLTTSPFPNHFWFVQIRFYSQIELYGFLKRESTCNSQSVWGTGDQVLPFQKYIAFTQITKCAYSASLTARTGADYASRMRSSRHTDASSYATHIAGTQ